MISNMKTSNDNLENKVKEIYRELEYKSLKDRIKGGKFPEEVISTDI